MNINRINSQKGIAQFLVIAVMAFLALGIPTATKLVQQNQENRSKAASNYTSVGTVTDIKQDEACGLVKFEELTPTTDKDNPSLLCKTGLVWQYNLRKPTCNGFSCDKLPPSLSQPYYSWYCVKDVDPNLDLTDPNIKQQIKDKVVECRNTTTTIIQENPKCGSANGQAINGYPQKEKLCAIGIPSEVALNRTTMIYTWTCQLGNNKVSCSSNTKPNIPTAPPITRTPTPKPPAIITISTKACEGSIVGFKPGVTQVTWTDDNGLTVKAKMSTYCGGATISNPSYKLNDNKLILGYQLTVGAVVTSCVCPRELTFLIKNLPKKEYEVSVVEPNIVHDTKPATNIRISPLGLSLKVGQSKNLTYILTPSNTTDTVKWSTSAEGMVRIQKITTKCSDSPNAKCIDVPGINNLLVTGLKAGTVKIKLTTSSGKTAQATVAVQK